MASPPNCRRFVFDLHKPIMTGTLLKQGGFHKAFKVRYFILYPGFLVYYDNQTTWQYDLQRGETLGSRIGAYKLRGGRVYKAKQHPRGAKYAFVLHAPDPHNKRHEVMFNCKSGEERYQWMHKIASAVPGVPDPPKPAASEQEKAEVTEKAEATESVTPKASETTKEAVDKATSTTELQAKESKEVAIEKKEAEEEAVKATEETAQSNATTPSGNSVDAAERPDTPDIDTVLGPITRKTVSTSSEESPAPEEIPTPEDTFTPDDSSREENSSREEDVRKGSVEVEPTFVENREEGGLVVSSISVKVGKVLEVELEERPRILTREPSGLMEHTVEATVEVQDSPRLSITVINTNDEYTDTSSDEEEPVIEPPFPIKQEANNGSPSPQHSPVFVTPRPQVEEKAELGTPPVKSPVPTQEEEGLKPGTPTFDKRRPSGVQAFEGKKGYMYKMGGRYKTWKLRYFVLMPGQFSYYKNDPKGKCLGEVKLKDMKIILPKPYEKTFSSFQFTIHTESTWNRRCDYVMAANSERDMKDWIDAFKIAGGLTHINGRSVSVSPSESGGSTSSA